ncbi:MAG TPA: TatD family hydrolase [Flavobacterium sp.]|nr:TatD family hydrolase [Flavobacterium sp.]
MYFDIHTHQFTNQAHVVEIVNQYPDEPFQDYPAYSIGIHPWRIDANNLNKELHLIEKLLLTPNCKAIGECGLDKRIETSIDVQKKVLIPQLLLAEKYKKPVILHCVAAFQEIIEIKKELKIEIPMIIHGFTKNEQVARSLINNGFYLSFGKHLVRNPKMEPVFKTIPKERVFLETDGMELCIFEIYKKAEQILGNDIKIIIEENFNKIFKL